MHLKFVLGLQGPMQLLQGVDVHSRDGGGVREGLSWPSDQKPISGSASCSCRPGVAKKYKNIVGKLETIQK